MKTPVLLLAFALAGSLSSTPASGQNLAFTGATSPIGFINGPITISPGTGTFKGNYRLNDGATITTGKYTVTRSFDAATSTYTESFVYTDASTGATSADSTATTRNTDESKTVVYTHRDFGATASFTATVSFPVVTTTIITPRDTTNTSTGASIYGTGTYTAADGTTGTLTVFDADGVISADLTNASGGVTRVLRGQDSYSPRAVTTVDTVSPAGVLTRTTLSRTSPHQH